MVPFFHRGRVDDWRVRCIHGRLETIDTRDAFRQPYVRRRALVPVTSYIEYDAPPGWAKGEPLRRWEVSWARRDSAQVRSGTFVQGRVSELERPYQFRLQE